MVNGLLLLHKEEGMTSHTAVGKVRRLFSSVKGGHTGTLDPMATGLLPVMLGRGVKAGEYLIEGDKHYIATLRLGLTTDTEDITGEVLTTSSHIPDTEAVKAAALSLLGESLQTPPMYSAIKVGGKKLMDLAREGKVVEREARPITVFSIEITPLGATDYALDVKCSKGTYIRTLCADIGKKLGCGGVMASLERVEACGFHLKDAHTLKELEAMTEEEREACVIPTEALFSQYPSVTLPSFYAKLCHNGQPIYQKKIGTSLPLGSKVRLYDTDGFFALGEVRDYPDGSALKPVKFFVL